AEAGPLIKSSTGALTARLKFFRALFGLDGAPLDSDIVNNYLHTLSASFDLKGKVCNRMQLAGILICADMMIRGGQIDVKENSVSGVGSIKVHDQLSDVLKGKTDGIDPKLAPVAWLFAYRQKNNGVLKVNITPNGLDIYF
ncbi:MAG: hypothetical protein IKJ28_05300, partial [Alphaproteobacteria bacterium]|nr:hypothetical protein [Alphaproteobacteria bacterium]